MTASTLDSFATHVPGLDEVLGGGLWAGSLYLLEGLPGTGKTILANQIAFARAALGEDVLYVSLISESHGKLVHHLRSMAFFEEAAVGTRVTYVSGYRSLADEGLPGLLQFLAAGMRERRPSFLVLEGFSSAEYMLHKAFDLAQFMHELNALASALRCTTLLVTHDQGAENHPDHTLVDGVLELTRVPQGRSTARHLSIYKIRGRDPILGEHAFSITSRGVAVYPRLEAVVSREPRDIRPPATRGRVPFGIEGLDRMLHGGLVAGGSTAIVGVPGSGKTLLACRFLEEGLRRGEKALFFGFHESPERLVAKAAAVGMDLARPLEKGALRLAWQPPLESALDELGWTLLDAVAGHRPARLVIDGVNGFFPGGAESERASQFLTALTLRLRALGVNALMTEELPLHQFGPQAPPHLISPVVENAILLRQLELRGSLYRYVSLLKVRESDFDSSAKDFRITDAGIAVGEASEDVLSAIGRRATD